MACRQRTINYTTMKKLGEARSENEHEQSRREADQAIWPVGSTATSDHFVYSGKLVHTAGAASG